jgi:ABC-type bacteriocin/lantibiotic exporter with double-glycine peptidase domain
MSDADIRTVRHAERRARMDGDFRRSLADFDSLVRGRFKRRLPEVEALPLLIRGACRVLEGGGMKPFTDFVVDPEESIPDALARFAADSSVRLRPVRLTGDWVRRLQGSLLVQVRRAPDSELEPLPLFKDWRGRPYLELPENGGRRVPVTADVQKRIEPVAYAFQPTLPAGKLTYREIMVFGLQHARWSFAEIALWGTLSALLSLAMPLVFGLIVGTVIPARDMGLLGGLVGALAMAALTLGVLKFAGDIAQLRLDGRLGVLVHGAMVDRLLRLPASVLRTQPSLILATQLETVEKFRRGMTQYMIAFGLAAIHFLVMCGFLLFYNVPAGLLALGLSGLLLVAAYAVGRRQFEVIYEGERIDVVVLAFVYDLIRLLPVLRASGGERLAFTQWAQNFLAFQSRLNRSMAMANVFTMIEAGWSTAIYIAVFAAIAFGAGGDETSDVAVALAVTFVAGLDKLVHAARAMAGAVMAGAKLLPQAKLARSFIEHAIEVPSGRVPVGTLSGEIEFAGVGFSYGGSAVLSDISLRIAPGSFVGIVGSSGSGKSTLVRLLLGLEEPRVGSIFFDGRDLATLDRRLVRRQIGAVLQHSRLFPGSIFENIRGASDIGLDEAWSVAELAGIADDLRNFPMGLHTLVGEDGAGLSGGQAQRLLLARALASQPRFLVFDEATSALDQAAQDRFVGALRQMSATRIMVAHRFSALRHCDEIVVLDRGRIADRGSFDELAGREGLFRAMLERQTGRIDAWGAAAPIGERGDTP